jgi:hypothetical protein
LFLGLRYLLLSIYSFLVQAFLQELIEMVLPHNRLSVSAMTDGGIAQRMTIARPRFTRLISFENAKFRRVNQVIGRVDGEQGCWIFRGQVGIIVMGTFNGIELVFASRVANAVVTDFSKNASAS